MMCFWDGFTQQNYIFCERQLCHWVQQPANTWSNVGYFIAAFLILRSDRPRTERLFFFWASFLLFLGSTLFHLSGTRLGKNLDVAAMLILSMGICAFSMKRWFQWDHKRSLWFYFVGLALSLGFLFVMGFGSVPFISEILIAAFLEFLMIRQGRGNLDKRWLVLALGIEALAGSVWILDVRRVWCDPENHWISGHGVWHLLSALAIYVFFLSIKASKEL